MLKPSDRISVVLLVGVTSALVSLGVLGPALPGTDGLMALAACALLLATASHLALNLARVVDASVIGSALAAAGLCVTLDAVLPAPLAVLAALLLPPALIFLLGGVIVRASVPLQAALTLGLSALAIGVVPAQLGRGVDPTGLWLLPLVTAVTLGGLALGQFVTTSAVPLLLDHTAWSAHRDRAQETALRRGLLALASLCAAAAGLIALLLPRIGLMLDAPGIIAVAALVVIGGRAYHLGVLGAAVPVLIVPGFWRLLNPALPDLRLVVVALGLVCILPLFGRRSLAERFGAAGEPAGTLSAPAATTAVAAPAPAPTTARDTPEG